jgi:hypothetical protein
MIITARTAPHKQKYDMIITTPQTGYIFSFE